MYELIQAAENTYYMDCPCKVGFCTVGNGEVVLIDSGSDKDAAKKVKKHIDANGWKLRAIFNTHSHADHIGGNAYLQAQTGCRIFAPGVERAFTEFPILEPTALYGGHAPAELHSKFLLAKDSRAETLTRDVLPDGMTLIPLPGHSYDMVGFRTRDDAVFLADCVSSAETLEKYGIGYLYDVRAYLDTLERVKTMTAACFIPAHAAATTDISRLAQTNIDRAAQTAAVILGMLSEPMTFDALLAEVFSHFGLTMTIQQHALIGSTVRSYLTYLKTEGKVCFTFADNRMLWRKI